MKARSLKQARNTNVLERIIAICIIIQIIVMVVIIVRPTKVEAAENGANQIEGWERIPLEVQIERDLDLKVEEFKQKEKNLQEMVTKQEKVKKENELSDIQEVEAKDDEQKDKDKELLAQLTWAELSILYSKHYEEEPENVEKVFKCTASAPMHRVEIGYRDADELEDVIFSKAYHSSTISKVKKGQEVPEIVYTWMDDVITNGPVGPRGMIYQAEFTQGDEIYLEIYNQKFCVETKYN